MATLIKDTHKVINFLQAKGWTSEQAESVITAINENANTDEFATKLDIRTAENNLVKWFIGVHIASLALVTSVIAIILG